MSVNLRPAEQYFSQGHFTYVVAAERTAELRSRHCISYLERMSLHRTSHVVTRMFGFRPSIFKKNIQCLNFCPPIIALQLLIECMLVH